MRRTPVKRSQLHPLWVLWVPVRPTRGKSVKKKIFKKIFFFTFATIWRQYLLEIVVQSKFPIQHTQQYKIGTYTIRKIQSVKEKKMYQQFHGRKKKRKINCFSCKRDLLFVVPTKCDIVYRSTVWKNEKFTINLKVFRENILSQQYLLPKL